MEEKKRLYYFDFLKAIGLLFVIMAYVTPPESIKIIRSFDVPLLVMVSASLSWITYKQEHYFSYVWKRIKRLVLPTWIYLLFCIVFFFVTKTVSISEVLPAFIFQKYVFGHTWIILLYLIVALIIPILRKLDVTKWYYFVSIFFILVFYEIICSKTNLYMHKILEYTLFYIVPYGTVSFLGIYAVKSARKELLIVSVFSLFICFIYFCYFYFNGNTVFWISFNQPARIYYLSYGVGISFILYFLIRDKENLILNNCFIQFLSQHSLWIYLWHSFWCFILVHFVTNWFFLYLLVVLASVFTVMLQCFIVIALKRKTNKLDFILNLFLG